MKLNRKFVACALATTMVVAPMSAFAEGDSNNIKDAKASVEGEGGLEGWVEKDKFLVTLPTLTADELAFKLDPQGLIDATTEGGSEDYPAGSVIFEEEPVVTLVNKSSYAVGFDVKLTLKSTDKDLKIAESADDVAGDDEDSNRNIYMAAQPYNDDGEAIEDKDLFLKAPTEAVEGVVAVKKFAYALADAEEQYEVKKGDDGYSFDLKDDAEDTAFDKVSFGFTGKVDPDADWSNYVGENADTMSLEVSYTVKKLGVAYDDEEKNAMVEGVDGLLVAEECTGVKAAPSAPSAAAFLSGANLTTVYSTVIRDVSVGEGELAATGIASIKVGSATVKMLAEVPTSTSTKGYIYDVDAETLTLYGEIISDTADVGKTADLVVTFNDTANTVVTITLTNTARPTE